MIHEEDIKAIGKQIGETFRSRRNELGLTMDEVALRMGYTHVHKRNYVSQLERGNHDYKLSSLLFMSEALDIPISAIVETKPDKNKHTDYVLLQNYRALPPKGKKEVRDFLDYLAHKYSN